MEKLLRDERDKNSGATGRKPSLNGDKVLPKRNRGHKARFLQIVKAGQSAVIFLCKARRSEYVIIQFPLRVCHVYHKERQQEHSFISAL